MAVYYPSVGEGREVTVEADHNTTNEMIEVWIDDPDRPSANVRLTLAEAHDLITELTNAAQNLSTHLNEERP